MKVTLAITGYMIYIVSYNTGFKLQTTQFGSQLVDGLKSRKRKIGKVLMDCLMSEMQMQSLRYKFL